MLISIATLGLNIFSSSNASSSSSSLKYCILDCILDALVDILDCILDVFVDILDPDIVVLPCSQGPTQLGGPPPLHYRPLGSRDLLSFSPLEETPPPEVVDSFPELVVNPRNNVADKRNGRLKLFFSSSADAMTLDQSRKQTRETGSVIIPVLQNTNSATNACSGKKTSLSGLQHCGQACCVVRHRGETVQRRSLAGAQPKGWGGQATLGTA